MSSPSFSSSMSVKLSTIDCISIKIIMHVLLESVGVTFSQMVKVVLKTVLHAKPLLTWERCRVNASYFPQE